MWCDQLLCQDKKGEAMQTNATGPEAAAVDKEGEFTPKQSCCFEGLRGDESGAPRLIFCERGS